MMVDKILTKEEVLQNGVCFEEELDWGGWYCEQMFVRMNLAKKFHLQV